MHMSAGLAIPTAGTATVLGDQTAGSPAALDGIGFVAQDAPVYRNLSAGDMLHLTRNLNRRFDRPYAQARLGELGIPLKKKASKLSGGQRAQLALTLARQDFMATVMMAMTDDGVSVLMSSHALAELERVADYLVLLSGGQLQVAGEVDNLLACHRVLTGPAAKADRYAGHMSVVQTRRGEAQAHLLVRISGRTDPVPPGWEAYPVSLEELVLAYLRAPGDEVLPGPSPVQRTTPTEVAR